jgi:hypothetical protein
LRISYTIRQLISQTRKWRWSRLEFIQSSRHLKIWEKTSSWKKPELEAQNAHALELKLLVRQKIWSGGPELSQQRNSNEIATNQQQQLTRKNPRAVSRAVQSELAQIEQNLQKNLLTIYTIMRQFDVPIEFFKNSKELNFQLYSIIRKSVQDSYLLGIETVGAQVKRRVKSFELFMSVTDIETIKSSSNEMIEQFWKTADRLLTRERATVEKNNVVTPKNPFDVEAAIEGYASLVVFTGYNIAVTSKLAQVTGPNVGLTAAISVKGIFSKIATSIADAFGDLLSLGSTQQLEPQQMFLTREDAAVDQEICAPLNRQVFDVSDPEKPMPPLHRFCRCTLIPVLESESETF